MERIALRYGLFMFLGFTLFFLISHLLGLSERYYLRVLNAIIHLAFMYTAIRRYRQLHPESADNYLSGTAMGMTAGVVGTLAFTIFIVLFLAFNQSFLAALRARTPMSEYLTPITAGAIILMEGIAVSLIGAYILTRIVDSQLEQVRT